MASLPCPGPAWSACAALRCLEPARRAGSLPFVLDPSFCARYLPGLPETAMAAVCTIPPPPQAPKGAVGLSVVQMDLGSSSFRHFVLLDDVCAALKRPVKSWSTGTLLYQLCVATNFHVDKTRCACRRSRRTHPCSLRRSDGTGYASVITVLQLVPYLAYSATNNQWRLNSAQSSQMQQWARHLLSEDVMRLIQQHGLLGSLKGKVPGLSPIALSVTPCAPAGHGDAQQATVLSAVKRHLFGSTDENTDANNAADAKGTSRIQCTAISPYCLQSF